MNDERAAEGIEHLQVAAVELIAAARAFLDVAEDVVADKARVADVVATVSALTGSVHGGAGPGPRSGPHSPRTARSRRVEHIDVS